MRMKKDNSSQTPFEERLGTDTVANMWGILLKGLPHGRAGKLPLGIRKVIAAFVACCLDAKVFLIGLQHRCRAYAKLPQLADRLKELEPSPDIPGDPDLEGGDVTSAEWCGYGQNVQERICARAMVNQGEAGTSKDSGSCSTIRLGLNKCQSQSNRWQRLHHCQRVRSNVTEQLQNIASRNWKEMQWNMQTWTEQTSTRH